MDVGVKDGERDVSNNTSYPWAFTKGYQVHLSKQIA